MRHPGVARGAERLPQRERRAGDGHGGGGRRPAPPRAGRLARERPRGAECEAAQHHGQHRRLGTARGGGEQREHGELAPSERLEPALERQREADEQDEAAGRRRASVHGGGEVAVERPGTEAEDGAGVGVEQGDGGARDSGAGVAKEHPAGVRQLQRQQADPEERGERQQRIGERRRRPVGGLDRQRIGQHVVVERDARDARVLRAASGGAARPRFPRGTAGRTGRPRPGAPPTRAAAAGPRSTPPRA